jgi:hypothetical protein
MAWLGISKRFWLIKGAVFAGLFPVLLVGGLLILFAAGMAGPGTPRELPFWFRVIGWLVMTPVRPSEKFPTSHGMANLLIAIGVNAMISAYVLSLLVAAGVSGVIRVVKRGREDGPAD